jgi:polyisoprenoid-binding protein YceI
MRKQIFLKALSFFMVLSAAAAFAAKPAKAEAKNQEWKIRSSEIKFSVSHLTHNLEGSSKVAKGKGICDATNCQFLVGVPALSFTTENSNRDQHMFEIIRAAVNPLATVSVSTGVDPVSEKAFNLDVSFAGKTHAYQTPEGALRVEKSKDSSTLNISGRFTIKLSDFAVERPALLAIPVSDEVPIDVKIEFEALR